MIGSDNAFPFLDVTIGAGGSNTILSGGGLTKRQWITTQLLAAYIASCKPMSCDDIVTAVMLANRAADALLGTFEAQVMEEEIIDLEQEP